MDEREVKAHRVLECYRKLVETLSKTYGVPPPRIRLMTPEEAERFWWAGAYYKDGTIVIAPDTTPTELIHEFIHYLQHLEGKKPGSEKCEEEAFKIGQKYGEAIFKKCGVVPWKLREDIWRGECPICLIEACKLKLRNSESF